MNTIIIVDASESDCRLMSGLLTQAWYEPVTGCGDCLGNSLS